MAEVRTTSRKVVSLVSPCAIVVTFAVALFTAGAGTALGQGAAKGRVNKPVASTVHSLNLDFNGEQPRPVAMVKGDFDGDGAPDLVVGYALGNGGSIQLLRGNPDALAPQSEETWQKIARGEYIDAFLQQSAPVKLQMAPSLMLAADVNGDGRLDLVYAGKGASTLQVMLGTGHGRFLHRTSSFTLPGPITALASYRPGGSLPGEALLVGYQTAQGARVGIVSNGNSGLTLNASYALPGAATMIAVAQLDTDLTPDAAIVAGGQLLVLHGYEAINGKGQIETLPMSDVVAVAPGGFLFDRHPTAQLAVLTASGDVAILAHQGFDPRPYTREELRQNRLIALQHRKNAHTLAQQAGDTSSAPWIEIERHSDPALQFSSSDTPVMLRARMRGAGGDDIVVLNSSQGQRVTISHDFLTAHAPGSAPAATDPENSSRSRVTVDSLGSGGVAAALAMRVSADGRPGLVVLHRNSPSPEFTVPQADNTFYVTSTADGAPIATPYSGTICSSASVAGCTLRDAITFANADAGDNGSGGSDTIMVPAGTYSLSYKAGTKDSGDNSQTHLELYGPVTIVGAGAGSTIVNANSNDMIFNVNPGPYGTYNQAAYGDGAYVTFDATLESMTLENGKNSNVNPYAGGSTGNENDFGGCIFWTATSGGNLNLTDVSIQSCSIIWGAGGGINALGDGTNETLTLTNSTISGNATSEVGGGVADAFPAVALDVTNSTFSNNSASSSLNASDTDGADGDDDGGAIDLDERQAGGSTQQSTIAGSTISGNSANGSGGGVNSATGVIIQTSVFSSNIANYNSTSTKNGNANIYEGGGVYVEVLSPEVEASIASTDFLGNTAYAAGGGVAQGPGQASSGNTMSIILSRFFGNTATSNANSGGLAVGEPNETAGTVYVGSVTAQNNWWGCNGGPSSPGNGCDQAELFPAGDANGTMNVTPYAQLAIGANTTSITLGNSIDLTVSLDTNSNGQSISGAFPAVSGDSIAYNVTGVTASPALTSGIFAGNGTDSPVLTPSSTGSGSVAAKFDNQTVTLSFSVESAPVITSASSTTFIESTGDSFTVTTTGFPTPAISESGTLPPGVTFVDNGNGTATLAGTPTGTGTFSITITANSGVSPNATQSFTLTVNLPQYVLTIAANPTAGGSVTPASGSLYNAGTVVPITATANAGYAFASWSSSPGTVANPASASTSITMSAAEAVTAQFSASLVVNTATDDYGADSASNCTPQATPGTNTIDAACSLRDALDFANNAGAASITFSSTVFNASNTAAQNTIVLGGAVLTINSTNVTITGPATGAGATLTNLVSISGNTLSADFYVNHGTATFNNLNITKGLDRSIYISAGYGIAGGVYSYYGTVAINGCTVSGNVDSAPSGYYAFGGGLFNYGGTMSVASCTISGNTAADTGGGGVLGIGGGIFNYGGTLTVTDSTISGNSATAVDSDQAWGGGITNYGGTATVINSTISGNSASDAGNGLGGGIYNGYGAFTLIGSTLSLNTADNTGGGIYDGADPGTTNPVANTIVSGNSAPSSPDVFASGVLQDNGGNQFTTGVALAPLANYGGSMQTQPPLPGDPSICGGTLANATAANLTTDQRGFPFDPVCPTGSVDSGSVQTHYTLGFAPLPLDVTVGLVIAPAPVVTLYESGVANTSASNPVTLSDAGATLAGPTTVNFVNGTATFSGVSFTSVGFKTELVATTALNSTISISGQRGGTLTVSPAPAAISSPAQGSTLTGPELTFTWNSVTGASGYSLWVGTTGVGSNNLYDSGLRTATSLIFANLPTNGATVFVRLYTIYNGIANSNDYTYTASTIAALTNPSPSSVLSGATVTFTWSAATGASGYSLWLGTTQGAHDLYDSNETARLSATATKLPTNGETVWARIYTTYNGVSKYADYNYTAAP